MYLLFEKIIQDGTINTEYLIEISQKRSELLEAVEYKRDCTKLGTVYYNMFRKLIDTMKQKHTRLMYQPLFSWHNYASSSWMFEKINVERLLADEYTRQARSTDDLKSKAKLYSQAVSFSTHALNTMGAFNWEDSSITHLPIFQDRFHIYNMLKNAAYYYEAVNDFAKIQQGTCNQLCVKRAYDCFDAASNIWKHSEADITEAQRLKCLHVLNIVKEMDDNACGERIALLQPFANTNHASEEFQALYTKLLQLNEAVYYQSVETTRVICPSPLTEIFRNLPKTIECE